MKKIFLIILSLLLIFGLVACTEDYNNLLLGENSAEEEAINMTNNEIRHVSMDDIEQIMRQNSGYIILDVRTIEEFNEGHIPNAICIPNEIIGQEDITELPDKEQLILVYCRSGRRSKEADEKLKNLGYTNIIEFGGIIDWKGDIAIEIDE